MRVSTLFIALFAATLLGATPVSHAAPIDLFEDGGFDLQADSREDTATPESVSVTEAGLDSATVLGGRRDVTLDEDFGVGGSARASLATSTGPDAVAVEGTNDGAAGLELVYGGGGDLNADFSNIMSIMVRFRERPNAPSTGIMVDLRLDSGSGSGEFGVGLNTSGAPNFPFEQSGSEAVFPFSVADFSNVDFSDIDRIGVSIITDQDASYNLSSIETQVIPTPAALPAGLLLLSGLLLRRRQRT